MDWSLCSGQRQVGWSCLRIRYTCNDSHSQGDHVSLLKPFRTRSSAMPIPAALSDPVLGQPDATTVDAQDDIQYRVQKFVDSQMFPSSVKYQVRWLGYKPAEDTW